MASSPILHRAYDEGLSPLSFYIPSLLLEFVPKYPSLEYSLSKPAESEHASASTRRARVSPTALREYSRSPSIAEYSSSREPWNGAQKASEYSRPASSRR